MVVVARILIFCAAVLALTTTTASADLDGSAGFIQVDAGLLSVKLEKVALCEVLRTVGEQAGVQVSIQGNLGNVQPQVFSGAPLPEGIRRLVENSNADLVMIYSRDDKTGRRYLMEIRAYEGNRNNRTSPSVTTRSLTVAPPPIVDNRRTNGRS
jgi:nucleotide-binding universal stress UspA family protein